MNRVIAIPFLAAALTASAANITTQSLELMAGEAFVLNESGVKRVAVGNGDTVSASVLDDKQLLFIPGKPGRTTIHLWKQNGQEKVLLVKVQSDDLVNLMHEIVGLLGDKSGVQASIVGDRIVLRGDQISAETAVRVAEIHKLYPQIANLTSKQTGFERMVYMDVRIMEMSKKAIENIGINWQKSLNGPMFGIVGDFKANSWFRPTSDGTPGNMTGNLPAGVAGVPMQPSNQPRISPFATYLGLQATLSSVVNFLVSNGDAYVLAEPKLSCRSGGTASFMAGGEVPIPVVNTTGQANVVFKPYGVQFNINPLVSDSGGIAATVSTELSAVDSSVTVQNIPGFVTRRTSTDVTLKDGETLVLSGLLNNDGNNTVEKVAGLGDLPILGPLFKSKDFRGDKTELVIMVTPHFIASDNALNGQIVETAKKHMDETIERVEDKPKPDTANHAPADPAYDH